MWGYAMFCLLKSHPVSSGMLPLLFKCIVGWHFARGEKLLTYSLGLEPPIRIERITFGLQSRCSTSWAKRAYTRHFFAIRFQISDLLLLNLQYVSLVGEVRFELTQLFSNSFTDCPDSPTSALPYIAVTAGLEPAVSDLTGPRFNQLIYATKYPLFIFSLCGKGETIFASLS